MVNPAKGGGLQLPSPLSNGEAFTTLNTLSIVNNGSVTTPVINGPYDDSPGNLVDLWLVGRNSSYLGGGRISLLANGNVSNTNILGTVGVPIGLTTSGSGGSVDIATTGKYYGGGSVGTSGGFDGGSVMIKTGGDLVYNPGNFFDGASLSANGIILGGTIRLMAKHDINYHHTDVFTSIKADGGLQGGVMLLRAGHDVLLANPFEHTPTTEQKLTANATDPTNGRGGYVSLYAVNAYTQDDAIEVNGSAQNGTTSFTRLH